MDYNLKTKIEVRREVASWICRWADTIKTEVEGFNTEKLIDLYLKGLESAIEYFKYWNGEVRKERKSCKE